MNISNCCTFENKMLLENKCCFIITLVSIQIAISLLFCNYNNLLDICNILLYLTYERNSDDFTEFQYYILR